MDPLRLKVNLTTAFVLPILYDKGLKHSDILTETFTNAYIADLNEPNQDNKLLIGYATITDIPQWTDTFSLYEGKNESMMVTHEVSDNYIEDYHKFLIGDYSKISEEYKQQILNFWEATSNTLLYEVLYKKGKEVKKIMTNLFDIDFDIEISNDIEWWKPPNLKKEIFGMGEE